LQRMAQDKLVKIGGKVTLTRQGNEIIEASN
jgi:Mn-dependent DtxR family transcriptional regulator